MKFNNLRLWNVDFGFRNGDTVAIRIAIPHSEIRIPKSKKIDFAVTKLLNSVFFGEFVIFAGQFTCETTRELAFIMNQRLYQLLLEAKKRKEKKFAVLIDPDKMRLGNLERILALSKEARVDYFFVGGSLVVHDMMDYCLDTIRKLSNIPTILFPGSPQQINSKADAILLLSLISGRNPDLLIGQHVLSATTLKKSGLEIMPTGYVLVDGGTPTTASYISGTFPIPYNKDEIAACTALAGEQLGLQLIYLDAGSGASRGVSESMISMTHRTIDVPLIVGGGIRTPEHAAANVRAGADIIVVGTALEREPGLMLDIADAVHSTKNSFRKF